jgi:type VI protein secretion system component VasK
MEATLEAQAFSILAVLALVLLVVVTGWVAYLTAADWRDRRRRKNDQDAVKHRPAKAAKTTKAVKK